MCTGPTFRDVFCIFIESVVLAGSGCGDAFCSNWKQCFVNDHTFQRCRDLLTHAYGIGKNSAFGASSVLRLLVLCGQRLLGAHRVLTEGKAAQTQQQKTHADIPELFIVCSLIPQYTIVGCVDVLSFLFYAFTLIF